jgi:hypothetical protein
MFRTDWPKLLNSLTVLLVMLPGRAYDYIGEILSTMLRMKAIDIPWVREQCEKAKISLEENPEKIISAMAGALEAQNGKEGVKGVFGESLAVESLEGLVGEANWKRIAADIL